MDNIMFMLPIMKSQQDGYHVHASLLWRANMMDNIMYMLPYYDE